MKTAAAAFLLAAASVWVATVPAARACRYCQQAADPEAYRFLHEGRNGGSFPLDGSLGNNYASDPVPPPPPAAAPAELKTVPDPAAVVTSAAALPARSVTPTAAVPVLLPVAPTTKTSVATAALPASPPAAPAATVASTTPSHSVRWADFGLLGLLGAGGFFAWRTRGTARSAATA